MTPTQQSRDLVLLKGGQAYFPALIEAIDGAQSWVQLETYIFDMHGMGASVADALIRAACRGVTVQVLVDGIGSGPLSAEWQKKMRDAGVQWCVYSPLTAGLGLFGLLMPDRWRRLHRKLCVIDQRMVFCGGINILDDLYDPNYGDLATARFDFAVAVTGPLAVEAADAVALVWWRVQAGYSARKRHLSAAWDKFKAAGYGGRTSSARLKQAGLSGPSSARATPGMKAVLVLRDNLRNRKSIEKSYLKAIGRAHHEITIANAYFLPGRKLRRALVAATQRGVKVTLLLQGKYEYFMQYHAARPVFSFLLRKGVEIHEYTSGFLHAKVAVIDGHWATVGSSNLDPLSLLLAREANVVVEDKVFAAQLQAQLMEAIASQGQKIDPAAYSKRPFGQRMLGYVAYALMRFGIWIAGQRY
jgi:cardiolipin synthase